MENYDPNGVGLHNGQIFGLPYTYEEADIVIVPVPWDVTTSYNAGTSNGPAAILQASPQLDLFDPDIKNAWETKIYLLPISEEWKAVNDEFRPIAKGYIDYLEAGNTLRQSEDMQELLMEINIKANELKEWIFEQCQQIIEDGKIPVVLGGEHSTPMGLIMALTEQHESFGILQIDAHADLRVAYEGFPDSHASIMHNALRSPSVEKLVSVGVRDICQAEIDYITHSQGRVIPFYDADIQEKVHFTREFSWKAYCNEIIDCLPQKVYISFDIDGLDPRYAPHTGTAVPGGLDLPAAIYLIKLLVQSGRQIIGFDLCEVAPNPYHPEEEWDANVGARVLFKLACWMAVSQGLPKLASNDVVRETP